MGVHDHDDCLDSAHTAAGVLSVQGVHLTSQQLLTIIAIWGTGMLLNDIELDLHTVMHRRVLEILWYNNMQAGLHVVHADLAKAVKQP